MTILRRMPLKSNCGWHGSRLLLAAACAVQTRLPWYVLPALIPAALLAASIPAYASARWRSA